MNRERTVQIAVVCFLVILGVAGRVAAYELGAWNFTPVAACGLFAGYYFARAPIAFAVPLVIMLVSNLMIGGYSSMGMLLAVHGALLLPVLLSLLVRNELSVPRLTLCALSSSVSFFLITNLAHWLFMRSSHSLSTLLATYVDAIPFFRSTLWGDLTWTALLFGSFALATRGGFVPRRYARLPVQKDD